MSRESPPSGPITAENAAALMEPLTELVRQAGLALLGVDRRAMSTGSKVDGSPVTEADHAADRIIADGLARLSPGIGTVSEERTPRARPPRNGSFFLIDPLDGTREFVAGRDEFTVNLALVTNGTPQLGIIGAPALGTIWRDLAGHGAERLVSSAGGMGAEPIHTRRFPHSGQSFVAAVSRSHADPRTQAFIDGRPGAVRQVMGSSLKFARLAEGALDIYPRLAPTHEWDIAAGCALVTAAGGRITDSKGADLQFGKSANDFIVPAFIAWGDPLVEWI